MRNAAPTQLLEHLTAVLRALQYILYTLWSCQKPKTGFSAEMSTEGTVYCIKMCVCVYEIWFVNHNHLT